MMKLLFMAKNFKEGEASTEYFKALSEKAVEEGHEVVIVSFDDHSHYSADDRVDVRRVKMPFEGDNIYNWSMMMNNELKSEATEIFEEEAPDIIHVIDWTVIPGGIVLSKNFGSPLVVTFQSTENERGFNGEHAPMISELEWQGAFEADKIIATSEDTKNSVLFDLDVPDEKVDVIDPFTGNWRESVLKLYSGLLKQEKEVLN